MNWWASVSPEDNENDAISRRQDSHFCGGDELGWVEVVRPGPILGNLGREGDQIIDLDGAEGGG